MYQVSMSVLIFVQGRAVGAFWGLGRRVPNVAGKGVAPLSFGGGGFWGDSP